MNSRSKERIVRKLGNKEYRDAYTEEHIKTGIAFQIKSLRSDRGLSQTNLAELAGTTQTAISRIENPEYGKLSIKTLLKVASALDISLLVKFSSYQKLLEETQSLTKEALSVKPFSEEVHLLNKWCETVQEKKQESITNFANFKVKEYFTQKSEDNSLHLQRIAGTMTDHVNNVDHYISFNVLSQKQEADCQFERRK